MTHNITHRSYTGSKTTLSDWILDLIQTHCKGDSFADLFAGTGIITQKASNLYSKMIVNDFLYSNNLIYHAFFEDKEYDMKKLEKIKEEYNSLKPEELEPNYFSISYGDKYYSIDDAKKIGYIRDDIEVRKDINLKEKQIILASLVYSIDKIANTVGHYDAFLRKKALEDKFVFEYIAPTPIKNIEIYREDVNSLARKISADIIYLDPPYNARQYCRFYHLLENLVKWDKPQLYGLTAKPEPENMSDFSRASAPIAFADLIENLDCKYLVLSYNNTYNSKSSSSINKLSIEYIEEILNQKGKMQYFEQRYRYFNTGKTRTFFDHREYLFITEVGKFD